MQLALHLDQADHLDTTQLVGVHGAVPGGQVLVPAMKSWHTVSLTLRHGPELLPKQLSHMPLPGLPPSRPRDLPADLHSVVPAGQMVVPW